MSLSTKSITYLLVLIIAFSLIGCDCNRGDIKPNSTKGEDTAIAFTSNTQGLEGDNKTFQLSIRNKKGEAINPSDYTLKLALIELGSTGSTLHYIDATNSRKDSPSPVVELLTHFKAQASLSSVSIEFTLQPQKNVTKVTITAALEHKDNHQNIPPVSIIWYQTTITETMIQDAKSAKQPLLADILEKLKDGQPVDLNQKYNQYRDANQELHLYNGEAVLHIAARVGNVDIVNMLIERGAKPDIQSESYDETPLFNAVREGHIGVVKALIKHLDSQQLNHRSKSDNTPLSLAISGNHIEIAKILIEKLSKEQLVVTDRWGDNSPLTIAMVKDSEEIVQALIDKLGPEQLLKKEKRLDVTPLTYSIIHGKIKLAKSMISNLSKEQLANGNSAENTPLIQAVYSNQIEIAKAITARLDKEQLNKQQHGSQGHTPLILAILIDKKEMATALIEMVDKAQWQDALLQAIYRGQEDVAQVLIDKLDSEQLVANVKNGWSALDYAINKKQENIVKAITAKLGKDLLPKEYTGYIPVVELINEGERDLAKSLINNVDKIVFPQSNSGADNQLLQLIDRGETNVAKLLVEKLDNEQLTRENANGVSPLILAIDKGQADLAQLLIEKLDKEQLNKQRETGERHTPLIRTISKGQIEAAKALIEKLDNTQLGMEVGLIQTTTPLMQTIYNGQNELTSALIEKLDKQQLTNTENDNTPFIQLLINGQFELY